MKMSNPFILSLLNHQLLSFAAVPLAKEATSSGHDYEIFWTGLFLACAKKAR